MTNTPADCPDRVVVVRYSHMRNGNSKGSGKLKNGTHHDQGKNQLRSTNALDGRFRLAIFCVLRLTAKRTMDCEVQCMVNAALWLELTDNL